MALTGRIKLFLGMIAALLVAAVNVVHAADAQALYDAGRFVEAAEAATRVLPEKADYALAAQAMLARIYYEQETRPRSEDARLVDLVQAKAWALKAIEMQPGDVRGYLQLVIAMGHEGQNKGALWVIFTGVLPETRALLDKALALAPDDPWVHGLVGGWNLELVRKGGATFAQDNGASFKKGMAAYHRALEIDPGNPLLRTEYALGLLLLDQEAHRDEALKILASIRKSPQHNFAEALAADRGLRARAMLERNDQMALETLLDQVDRWRSVE